MKASKLKWRDKFTKAGDKRVFTCEGHPHENYIWVSWRRDDGTRHAGELHIDEEVTLVKEGLGH